MKAPTIQQFRRSFGSWLAVKGKWKGDAYNYHPHGVIARPMIYTDHHNVSGSCEAQVRTEPSSKMKPWDNGREASCYGGAHGPRPLPEMGSLVTVYRSGEWVGPDGPWRARMRKDMADTLRNIRAIVRAQDADRERERAKREAAREEAFASAKRAFATQSI